MMKTTFLSKVALVAGLTTSIFSVMTNDAHATIPRSGVSSLVMQVYGLYFSSDPTCQTNLVATIPISKSAQSVDFLQSPVLGSGIIPSSVNCIVAVIKNSVNLTWASGSYTSTSSGGSDNVCNSGGTATMSPCNNASKTISWPATIQADMNAAGLTLASACSSSPTGNEIIPIYLSSYSACTNNSVYDPLLGRSSCSANAFTPPTSSTSTSAGLALSGSTAQAAYAFVVDPTGMVGNSSGSCAATFGAPRFGARGAASIAAATTTATSPGIASVALSGSITPAAGPTGGSSSLVITGSNFEAGAQVSVGSTPCTGVVVNAAGTQITCTTGAASKGVVSVTVTNPSSGGSVVSGNSFEYRAAVTVTGVTPTQVPKATNQLITITGTGFRGASTLGTPTGLTAYAVSVGAQNCSSPVIQDSAGTSIQCTVNYAVARPQSVSIYVTNYPDTSSSGAYSNTPATGFVFY